MESRRAQRVSEALREELAEIIGYELADPRLLGVTVTEAHLSPDGKHAQVLVLLRGTEPERRGALDALEHARHHLRREVASRLRLFRPPELHFDEDVSGGGETRVDELLKRIHKTEEQRAKREVKPSAEGETTENSQKNRDLPAK